MIRVSIESNLDDLKRFIDYKVDNFVRGKELDVAIRSIGSIMKYNVITANRTYDLLQSGQILRYLRKERPLIRAFRDTDGIYKYYAYYGNINKLSNIYRPEQRVLTNVISRERTGASYTISQTEVIRDERYFAARRGDSPFPYWLAIEFGTLSRRDPIPKKFVEWGVVRKKGKSSSVPYKPVPFGMSAPAGHKKRIFLMKPIGGTHPGVIPSRIFRKGLAQTFPYVNLMFRKAIEDYWAN